MLKHIKNVRKREFGLLLLPATPKGEIVWIPAPMRWRTRRITNEYPIQERWSYCCGNTAQTFRLLCTDNLLFTRDAKKARTFGNRAKRYLKIALVIKREKPRQVMYSCLTLALAIWGWYLENFGCFPAATTAAWLESSTAQGTHVPT